MNNTFSITKMTNWTNFLMKIIGLTQIFGGACPIFAS